ncbi:MAG: spore protease YyaC [Lachnospiraceae bacterium]|nr:spore protease YyaC [Lachnospiraceae bacterium]
MSITTEFFSGIISRTGNCAAREEQASTDSRPLCPALLGQLLKELESTSGAAKASPVILCIGTDRMIGDSLGPLTGSLLSERAGSSLVVYGTLNATVHACNLKETLARIKKEHPRSTVIAVDASLGRQCVPGSVFVRAGSLKPGMGVSKNLPAAGDISITGIAGAQSGQPWLTLQTARLSLIMGMAEQICTCILDVCIRSDRCSCQPLSARRTDVLLY